MQVVGTQPLTRTQSITSLIISLSGLVPLHSDYDSLAWLRTPADEDQSFQLMTTRRSDGWRPPIPGDRDHRWTRMMVAVG
jgi:hypothetical protein